MYNKCLVTDVKKKRRMISKWQNEPIDKSRHGNLSSEVAWCSGQAPRLRNSVHVVVGGGVIVWDFTWGFNSLCLSVFIYKMESLPVIHGYCEDSVRCIMEIKLSHCPLVYSTYVARVNHLGVLKHQELNCKLKVLINLQNRINLQNQLIQN